MSHWTGKGLPQQNSLWSRKDARRPGIVRVIRAGLPNGGWVDAVDVETGRETQVRTENWARRYRPYTAPETGTPTAPPDEQEK